MMHNIHPGEGRPLQGPLQCGCIAVTRAHTIESNSFQLFSGTIKRKTTPIWSLSVQFP